VRDREKRGGGRFIVQFCVDVIISILVCKGCGDEMGKLYRV